MPFRQGRGAREPSAERQEPWSLCCQQELMLGLEGRPSPGQGVLEEQGQPPGPSAFLEGAPKLLFVLPLHPVLVLWSSRPPLRSLGPLCQMLP